MKGIEKLQIKKMISGEKYNPVEYEGQWIISLIEAQFLEDPNLILGIVKHITVTEDETN